MNPIGKNNEMSLFESTKSRDNILASVRAEMPMLAADWKASDTLPNYYKEKLPVALERLLTTLEPPSKKQLAVAIKLLVDFIEDFGLAKLSNVVDERESQLARLAKYYARLLGDLPADLLILAIMRTMRTHKLSILPLPAEVRSNVRDELAHRRILRMQFEAAIKFGRFDAPSIFKGNHA